MSETTTERTMTMPDGFHIEALPPPDPATTTFFCQHEKAMESIRKRMFAQLGIPRELMTGARA